ncbi:hypothetical protein HYH03_015323 [Edaphochlamys debaryana]|uniref:Uncharacterized protein n=1 Tax=Edaphochlamys debaryana TaxID=47281 RepID=A0A836BRB5_9CHLO|nr:hypothetical protein HYH03_015323 [Edaphochlamys debaryana]|eukprot:KAG2486010.1 hypothetical protein HYH03_015323 [Edaphochlamys debaryana]
MDHAAAARRQQQPNDPLRLDPSLQPDSCARELWLNWTKELLLRPQRPSLLWALARTYGRPYAWLGLAKLLNDLLGFVGPLLLKDLVGWLAVGHANDQPPTAASAPTVNSLGLTPPTAPTLPEALREWLRWLAAEWGPASPRFGLVCVAALAAASVARALFNSHFNYQLVSGGGGGGRV